MAHICSAEALRLLKMYLAPSCLLLKVKGHAGLSWLKQLPGLAGGVVICEGCSKAAAQASQPCGCNLLPLFTFTASFHGPSEESLLGPCGRKAALPLYMATGRLSGTITSFSVNYFCGVTSSITAHLATLESILILRGNVTVL